MKRGTLTIPSCSGQFGGLSFFTIQVFLIDSLAIQKHPAFVHLKIRQFCSTFWSSYENKIPAEKIYPAPLMGSNFYIAMILILIYFTRILTEYTWKLGYSLFFNSKIWWNIEETTNTVWVSYYTILVYLKKKRLKN